MSSNFIHLHSHSEYSLDIGFFSIPDYIRCCYQNKFESAVITERFNLYSSIKFYKECINFSIKPIIGCEFLLEYNSNENSRILILCKNKNGYKNLITLISKAHTNNIINGIPILKYEWFINLNDGLIIIGLSFESDIGLSLINEKKKNAFEYARFWKKIFKNDYYLSISKFGIPAENVYLERLFNINFLNEINLVALNEVSFLRKKDFLPYKSKIAMFDQEKRIILDVEDIYFKNKYFKDEEDMFSLFEKEKNSLYNTIEITKKCNFSFDFKTDYSPKYLKNKKSSNANIIIKKSLEALIIKLKILDLEDWKYYINRLSIELKVITKVGFENYFLITHDFILWAKKNDIYVGPGRGSCSGSLVAYFLKITSIDPIKYNLLFERFLNKDRLSKPDFDIDFCIENRDLVIDYIYDEYKIENVAQIITFGCMNIKAVIRDIGRVLGYSYGFIDKITKLLSNDYGISLKSEIIHNQNFKNEYDASYDIQNIINLSLKLEGIIKNVSTHAGGLIISPIKLITNIPLSLEDENNPLTQFDKNDSDLIGFVKFDFLGLKNLTIIASIIESITSYKNLFEDDTFVVEELMPDEKRTFELLQQGDTTGIFQLESTGIKSVVQKMKPSSFLDISALIALYRPGPLQSGMLTSFIKRRLGIEKIEYIHKRLEKILNETYGMIIYQEQVMLIAQIFSGYDLSLADFLRIAMSKKRNEEMLTHLEHFSNGAAIYNIDKETAKNVFYLVEKFAGYGFNKAHSVGYAYLTYNMAWLKANYNCIFISSLLSSDMYNHENLDIFIKDAIHFNIKIITPDINRSFYNFTIYDKFNIRYGFGALKNIGTPIISEIIENRSIFGPFNSFLDFLKRINLESLSKKILQNLIYSGVFDKLNCFKFKLVLITAKVFDIYFNLKKNIYKINYSIDDYFKKIKKTFTYITSYKQTENTESNKLFPQSFINTKITFYKHEFIEILKLSYKSGIYSNIFILGIIDNIEIKKYMNWKRVIIHINSLNKKHKIEISYDRYLFIKDLIIKNKLLVFCCYLNNNLLKELFIEDFYIYRSKFTKFLDLIFTKNFITENFLKHFFHKISSNFIKGPTILRLKIISKNKFKFFYVNVNLKILIHDDLINNLKKFKEITKIKFTYFF